jgi:hypothetical protein
MMMASRFQQLNGARNHPEKSSRPLQKTQLTFAKGRWMTTEGSVCHFALASSSYLRIWLLLIQLGLPVNGANHFLGQTGGQSEVLIDGFTRRRAFTGSITPAQNSRG